MLLVFTEGLCNYFRNRYYPTPRKTVRQFELLLAAASERDHESARISVQTHLRVTESIESDMLSHDRHASIKLYTVDHRSLFDYRYGVRRGRRAPGDPRSGCRAWLGCASPARWFGRARADLFTGVEVSCTPRARPITPRIMCDRVLRALLSASVVARAAACSCPAHTTDHNVSAIILCYWNT